MQDGNNGNAKNGNLDDTLRAARALLENAEAVKIGRATAANKGRKSNHKSEDSSDDGDDSSCSGSLSPAEMLQAILNEELAQQYSADSGITASEQELLSLRSASEQQKGGPSAASAFCDGTVVANVTDTEEDRSPLKAAEDMTRDELVEALEAERFVTNVLRAENTELRSLVSAMVAEMEALKETQSRAPAPVNETKPPTSASTTGAPPPNNSNETPSQPKPRTMAALFGGRLKSQASSSSAQSSQPNNALEKSPSVSDQTGGGPSAIALEHERRKAEILRKLAEEDELSAAHGGPEDPFVVEARRKHVVIDDRFAGISAVGFGNGPNPRGYIGGVGGSYSTAARGPTASMEGDPSEVQKAMRQALEEGIMDDRRAVLEADEDAKLEARLKRLQAKK